MTASDVPEAVRPWLDALRAVWPECVVTFSYSFGGWYDVVRWPSRPEGWDCSIHSDGEVALCQRPGGWLIDNYFDPASLVARLRELLPVPAKPEPECIPCEAGVCGRHRVPTPTATYTCARCAISWVTADGARCPGCERAERRERALARARWTDSAWRRRQASAPQANPLRDASRRLVDEIARYQRAGRGTPLPSEMLAAVEDVRTALEVL